MPTQQTKLITLFDSFKQSVSLLRNNVVLGFIVKVELVMAVISSIVFIPAIILYLLYFVAILSSGMYTVEQPLPDHTLIADAPEPDFKGIDEKFIPVIIILLILVGLAMIVYIFIYTTTQVLVLLRIHENKLPAVKTLVKEAISKAPNLFVLSFMRGFLVTVGYILFIVPGVMLAIKYSLATFAMLDGDLGPIEALKKSAELTKGYRINLYLKYVGLLSLQIALILPILIVLGFSKYTSVGGFVGLLYMMIMQLMFLIIYKDLVKIKATPQISEPVETKPTQ